MFLNSGDLRLGDRIRVIGKEHETIPYDIRERIIWYLNKQAAPVDASTLVHEIGLSASYCRALPKLIRGLPFSDAVIFKNQFHALTEKNGPANWRGR